MTVTTTEILLSFLPVLLLIVVPLISNIRLAAIVTFIITSIIYFIWQSPVMYYAASLIASLVATVNILMIVFGAIFLYEMMQLSGYINRINHSVSNIHPVKEIRFFLIAIGLTGFFEGVAGFGTPGAIVPLLLISMGFHPLLSVAAVLLFDGLFAAFGAVGTPLLAGLKLPLALSNTQMVQLSMFCACMLAISGMLIFFFVTRMYEKYENKMQAKGKVFFMLVAGLFPLVVFSYYWSEYSTIVASVVMLVISVLYVTGGKPTISIKAWLPYITLVLLLLLPKIILPLGRLLSWEWKWDAIFSTQITASLKPLQSPLLPFLFVAFAFTQSKKHYGQSLHSAGKKLASVALLLFPIIAVAQFMLTSGFSKPSMTSIISETFSRAGQQGYIMLAPFLGITGTFITGSTTLSNIVFGYSHQQTADLLSLDTSLVLSLQLAGASIGNAVCLFNIIAACSVANIKDPNKVLLKNLLPVVVAWIVIGLAGLWLLAFYN